jgi:hypothetical protein
MVEYLDSSRCKLVDEQLAKGVRSRSAVKRAISSRWSSRWSRAEFAPWATPAPNSLVRTGRPPSAPVKKFMDMTPHFPIYMDYGATTPVDPRVVDAMIPWLREHFGNPASRSHAWGWEAEEAVEKAREQVAD